MPGNARRTARRRDESRAPIQRIYIRRAIPTHDSPGLEPSASQRWGPVGDAAAGAAIAMERRPVRIVRIPPTQRFCLLSRRSLAAEGCFHLQSLEWSRVEISRYVPIHMTYFQMANNCGRDSRRVLLSSSVVRDIHWPIIFPACAKGDPLWNRDG